MTPDVDAFEKLLSIVEKALDQPHAPSDEDTIIEIVWWDGLLTAAAIGPEQPSFEELLQQSYPNAVSAGKSGYVQLMGAAQRFRLISLRDRIERDGPDFQPSHLDAADIDTGIERATQWVHGFMSGIELRSQAWSPVFQDESMKLAALRIAAFVERDDGTPVLNGIRPADLVQLRAESVSNLGKSVFQIKSFFEQRREDARRHGGRLGKVGRNEPCPCGSGKKYKRCCLN